MLFRSHKCSGAGSGKILGMFLLETAIIILFALLLMGLILLNFRDFIEDTTAVELGALFSLDRLWVPLLTVAILFLIGGALPGRIFARIPVSQVFRRYTEGKKGWKRPLLFVQFAGVLADCTLTETGAKTDLLQQALIAQLAHSERLEGIQLPEPDEPSVRHTLSDNEPRIVLNDGTVSYNDRPILHHLSWRVNPGEHWQIVGPNGAGKSTLLSLITGDHPQGYSNDLTLFGRRRGSGETIWDIKKHIGYVSSSLHLDYRVSTTVRNVILSGYFDSIGIYQAVSDRQHKLVQQWLDILGIDKRTADAPFHSLSWGQQRLALIVRALVKHPTLLILDEPLQGLDPLNRQLIRRFVDVLIGEGETQLLFVSHHAEDAPACITHRLEFVPEGDIYGYRQTSLR